MECKILRRGNRTNSRITPLGFERADFGLFRNLLGTILGENTLERRELVDFQESPLPPSSRMTQSNKIKQIQQNQAKIAGHLHAWTRSSWTNSNIKWKHTRVHWIYMAGFWQWGVAGRPLWREAEAAPCQTQTVPAGSTLDPLQDTDKLIREAGSAPGKTYLRKGQNTAQAVREKGVRNNPHNERRRRGRQCQSRHSPAALWEPMVEQASTLQTMERTTLEQVDISWRSCSPLRAHTGAGSPNKNCSPWRSYAGAGWSWRTQADGKHPCWKSSWRTEAHGKDPLWSSRKTWGGRSSRDKLQWTGQNCHNLPLTCITWAGWGRRVGNEAEPRKKGGVGGRYCFKLSLFFTIQTYFNWNKLNSSPLSGVCFAHDSNW